MVGILGGLLYRVEGVMLTLMYSVTGRVERAVSPASFSRTQGISTREMFSQLNERGFLTERTALRGWGYSHLMGPYNDIWICRPLRIEAKCEKRRRLYMTE